MLLCQFAIGKPFLLPFLVINAGGGDLSFWEDWFKRRRRSPFFEEIDRMFEDMFRDLSRAFPEELVKERKLPDGTTVRTWGPFVYGYSMSVGPDGKPVIREFGNLRPSRLGVPKAAEEREPLVDVVTGEKVVQVIAEVPGIEKEDINLLATEGQLTISVDTEKRKYHKVVDLPAKVDPKSAKASYKNGVLEVSLERLKEKKPSGERISIE